MKQLIDTEFLLDCRRNAYVDCSMQYMEHNNVIGYFGQDVPLEVLYGFGLIPVPLEDVDAEIFRFTSEALKQRHFCDCIQSTLTYLETDKCPILFSCKAYVFGNSCDLFFREFSSRTPKICIHLSSGVSKAENESVTLLREIAGRDFDKTVYAKAKENLAYINSVLEKIEHYSNATALEIFMLEFYSPYIIDLTQRVNYFKQLEHTLNFTSERKERKSITAACPRGAFKSIFAQTPDNARVLWQPSCKACETASFDFADAACVFSHSLDTHY